MRIDKDETLMIGTDKKINEYIDNLKLWNSKVNLVSRDDIDDIYTRHILDCMQTSKYLNKGDNIIDVGSGAGLPGVILSIMGYEHVTLCEKNYKKCIFLYDIKDKLGLKYNVYNGDVYKYTISKESRETSVLVSRAFASLSTLLDIMIQLEVDRGVLHKGESYNVETKIAQKEYHFNYEVHKSETDAKGVILAINSVRRK